MAFARTDPAVIDRLQADGVLCYRMAPDTIRLVTSFQTTDDRRRRGPRAVRTGHA